MQAERSVRELSHAHEDRVALLEARLAELSTAVASYDRSHQTDVDTIQSLKVFMS